jgi:hypothetical protein
VLDLSSTACLGAAHVQYMVSDHFGLLMTLEPVELQGGLA